MAGGNHPKSSSHKPSSSSSHHRKSRWESNSNSTAKSPANPKPSSAADSKQPQPPPPKPSPNPKNNNHNNKNPNPPKPGPSPSPRPTHQSGPNPIPPPGPPFSFPDPSTHLGPPPPPTYGFHMLDRRTIVLADGSVRSYFALPPDYQDFTPPIRPPLDFAGRFYPVGHGGHVSELGPLKRKYGEEEEREREGIGKLLRYGNMGSDQNGFPSGSGIRGEFFAETSSPFGRSDEMRSSKSMRIGGGYDGNVSLKHNEVDQKALKEAFLRFVKVVNDGNQRTNYIENGNRGPLQCVACGRSSKNFPDMHGLIMHTYYSDNAELLVDHLGLHKALCVLMGWNSAKPPDNSKAYQLLSADEAAANLDDLIMWPPMVIIQNTWTGKGRDGRMEGLGNKAMDAKLKDLGCRGGKARTMYGREGHMGITLVKFASDQSGLKEALKLAEYFEKDNHGRRTWARVQSSTSGKDDESNPNLVKVDERTREKKRILYGYLGTAFDLENVDFETRKKVVVTSLREYKLS